MPHPSPTNVAAVEKKPSARKESINRESPRVKQESKVEKPQIKKAPSVKKEPTVKNEARVKKEPGAKSSYKFKHEVDADSPRTSNSPGLGLINGIYDLSCPTVEGELSCSDLILTLCLDGTTVWGAYDLGMFSGVLFLARRPWQVSDGPLRFNWRCRENGEGEMSIGQRCEGEISFLGNGIIEGCISVYGRCFFQGMRRSGAGTAVRTAKSMKAEWEGYNEQAYEEENRSRWG